MRLKDTEQRADEPQEMALVRCSNAKKLEDTGDYEAACGAMGSLWTGVGHPPALNNLSKRAKAEVLLRAGTLTGRLGRVQQLAGSQKMARDLLNQSISLFKSLNENRKAQEAAIELAGCYYREGALNAARATLQDILSSLPDECEELRAAALLWSATCEYSMQHLNEAYDFLAEALTLLEASDNHLLRGNVHNRFGVVLWALGRSLQSREHLEHALQEYKTARAHFESAGHKRNIGGIENNLGLLYFELAVSGGGPDWLSEAFRHLEQARTINESLHDSGLVAQGNESLARVLLAQGRIGEAEKAIREALNVLDKGGQTEALAEALRTLGVILARLGRLQEATAAHERAIEIVATSRIKPVDL